MKTFLAWFVCAFCLLAGFRWIGGAFESELGGHPDEAAHFVTGLMVHDYLAAGAPGSPMRFARDYYGHYPKIGLGVWPPFFYLVQAAWSFLFPATGASAVALICVLGAAVAALLAREVAAREGALAGGLAAVLLCLLPLVQEYSGLVMAEMLSTLLMFAAVTAFGRFLEEGGRRSALGFGLLAALAILTKGTGLALALVPFWAVVLTRRWRVLMSPNMWLAAVLVAVLAGPWTWMTRDLGHGGWVYPQPAWAFTREAVPYYGRKFAGALGPGLLLLAVVGAVSGLRNARHTAGVVAHVAFVLSVLLFQSVLPVGYEARHLIPIVPSGIYLAFNGARAVANRLSRAGRLLRNARAITFALLMLSFLMTHPQLVRKHESGFRSLAAAIRAQNSEGGTPAILVSSDARGEGMFIAEVASTERRPGSKVERASKALASSQWSGRGYQATFTESREMFEFLKTGRFDWVVVDASVPRAYRRPHHDLLLETVQAHPECFQPLAHSTIARGGRLFPRAGAVYRIQRQP